VATTNADPAVSSLLGGPATGDLLPHSKRESEHSRLSPIEMNER
jgi:hypothetical protein